MAFETIDQVVKAKSENSSINYKFVGHCVEISRICSDTSYILFFLQEFVKAFLLAKRVDFTKKDIVRENFSFFHTMLERLRTSNYESCCMSLLSKTLTQQQAFIRTLNFAIDGVIKFHHQVALFQQTIFSKLCGLSRRRAAPPRKEVPSEFQATSGESTAEIFC